LNTPVEKIGEKENPNPYENTDENLENDKKEEITEEKMEKRRTTVVFDTETTIPSEDEPPKELPLKKWLPEIRECFRFCDEGDWAESGILGKIAIVFFSPVYLFCMWTIPVLPLDRKLYDEKWNKPLAMIQAFLIPTTIYVFRYGYDNPDFGCDEEEEDCSGFPRWAIGLIAGPVFALFVLIFSNLQKPPIYWSVFPWLGFVTGIMWIGMEANEVVNLLVTLGVLWKIPSIIMGLTFLAIANNLGDFIADPALAQQGNSRMGFTACYGGPLMNLILGTGLATLVTGLTGDLEEPIPRESSYGVLIMVDWTNLVLYSGVLLCGFAAILMLSLRDFKADTLFGIVLCVLYALALSMIFLISYEVIKLPDMPF